MLFSTPLHVALIALPIIWIVLTVPLIIWQYRKYGSLSIWRALMVISFTFYMVTVYFLIMLPLPNMQYIQHLEQIHAPTMNWNPIAIFNDFFRTNPIFHGGNLVAMIKDSSFTQPIFNILMTLPFGIYLRYYFKVSIKKIFVFGFFLSLFFELTQLSGLYGIYPRPYRLFDVDDLLTNTLGAGIGGLIAPYLSRIIPNLDKVDERAAEHSSQVSIVRRTVAFVFDFVVFAILWTLTGKANIIISGILASLVVWLALPLILKLIFHRYVTLGSSIVNYRMDDENNDSQIKFWQVLVRWIGLLVNASLFGLVLYLLNLTGTVADDQLSTVDGMILVAVLPLGLVFIDILLLINTKHRLWYERLSRTHLAGKKVKEVLN
ncbi:MAG: VanZ family protein [Lactobacillaceae bacterium]|nr:VanZ family protein [Lactobacillaceae bacterium]